MATPESEEEPEADEMVMVEVSWEPGTVIWLVKKDVMVERLVEVPSVPAIGEREPMPV